MGGVHGTRSYGSAGQTWAEQEGPPFGRQTPSAGLGTALARTCSGTSASECSVATIPPDNNIAEASLRRLALGRSNFLFVGHEDAGHNIAGLYTLVASCEKHGVNAIAYLTDVLTRVQTGEFAPARRGLAHALRCARRA